MIRPSSKIEVPAPVPSRSTLSPPVPPIAPKPATSASFMTRTGFFQRSASAFCRSKPAHTSVPRCGAVKTFPSRTATVQVKAPAYAANIQPIWDAHCTTCHPSDGSLDLTAANSYAQLVDQIQAPTGGGCDGEKLVDTSAPSASSLPKWLSGITCGSQMPKGNPALSPGDLVKVQSWIDSGAANN